MKSWPIHMHGRVIFSFVCVSHETSLINKKSPNHGARDDNENQHRIKAILDSC